MDDSPLKFPTDAEVAAEEAARFRFASPAERMRAIRSTLDAGALLIERSPKREFLEAEHRRQEQAAHETIARFVERHAPRS